MNYRFWVSLVVCQLSITMAFSQNYEIANWLDDKKCAVVLTFDDWDPSHSNAMNLMIQKGIVGSFYITINNAWQADAYDDMQDGIDNGIEIGNHTQTHADLATLSLQGIEDEIEDCRVKLNQELAQDNDVHTLVYPFGSYNNNVIAETRKYHIGARTVFNSSNNWGYNYPTTEDEYYKIPTVQVGIFGDEATDIGNFEVGLDAAESGGGLYTIMYHSIQPVQWFDPISLELFMLQLDEVKSRENKDWVTTFSNAVRYHREKHCSTLATVSNDNISWVLNLTDTLSDNNLFDQPLTIKLDIPSGETYSSVKQGDDELDFEIIDGGSKLVFNAAPDAGEIVLEKATLASLFNATNISNRVQIYPNPNVGVIEISGIDDVVKFTILNNLGTTITTDKLLKSQLDLTFLEAGIYYIKFDFTDGTSETKKMIKE